MFINRYPYTDTHELNLDWIIRKMKELKIEFDEFKVVNNITFSGQWDITKQYPAWTIVSDNNIGYVSQQPVPAGVVLSNTDYWVEVIDYTAQIAGLQTRVVALEYNDGVQDGEITTIQNDINTLDTLTNRLANRKYLFVSDSYGASIIPKLVAMLDLTSSDYVSLQVGGSGFGPALTDPLNWQYIIKNATVANKETFTDVVYIGGVNEIASTAADISAHAASCYDYVHANYVNAKQWYFMDGYVGALGTGTYSIVDRTRVSIRVPQCIVDSERAFIIKEVWYPLTKAGNMQGDNLHPTDDGAKAIAQLIASGLNGGTPYYSIPMSEVTVTSSVNTVSICQVGIGRVNSVINGYIRNLTVNLASPVNIGTSGTSVILGSIPNDIIRGGMHVQLENTADLFLGTVPVYTTVGGYVTGELFLTINNELKVTLMSRTLINNAADVIIQQFKFLVDSYIN